MSSVQRATHVVLLDFRYSANAKPFHAAITARTKAGHGTISKPLNTSVALTLSGREQKCNVGGGRDREPEERTPDKLEKSPELRTHNQNNTVAARAMADMKTPRRPRRAAAQCVVPKAAVHAGSNGSIHNRSFVARLSDVSVADGSDPCACITIRQTRSAMKVPLSPRCGTNSPKRPFE
jgi:hypothetical protein